MADLDDFPIGMAEAKKIRLELMGERKYYVQELEDRVQENSLSCEH